MAQLMARLQRESIRSGSEWLLPVLESRPANTMGSRPPSNSGRATYTQPTMLMPRQSQSNSTQTRRTYPGYLQVINPGC